uniref:Deoxyribonuclease II n=1 Tax=Trichuris muris TaxID=70415 RepID=A0A5S6QCH2_TRIMR
MELPLIYVQLVLLWQFGAVNSAALSCKDAAGANIAWGVFYVVPGTQTAHAIYAAAAPGWEANPIDLKTAGGVLDGLFAPFVAAKATYNVLAYSNFPPYYREGSKCGSALRGVLGYTDSDGWWLTHTIDKWPDLQAGAIAPPSAGGAGLIVCVTLPFASMPTWATTLDYASPMLYYQQSTNPPAATSIANVPALAALTQPPVAAIYSPFTRTMMFTPTGNNPAPTRLFTKLPRASIEIHSNYMAQILKQNLIVWSKAPSGESLLRSSCTGAYQVENVKGSSITVNNQVITRQQDTASWAVSKAPGAEAVFCVSGSDRTQSSIGLAGGVVCLQQQQVQQLFSAIATAAGIEACPTAG